MHLPTIALASLRPLARERGPPVRVIRRRTGRSLPAALIRVAGWILLLLRPVRTARPLRCAAQGLLPLLAMLILAGLPAHRERLAIRACRQAPCVVEPQPWR